MTHPHDTAQIPGIMLYRHLYEALSSLEFEAVGRLTLAMMEYTFFDLEPQIPPELEIAWSFLKNYADRDSARYLEKVRRRRAAAEKRWSRERSKGTEPAAPPVAAPSQRPPCERGLLSEAKLGDSQKKNPSVCPTGSHLPLTREALDSPLPDSEPSYDGLRPYRDEKGVIRYK